MKVSRESGKITVMKPTSVAELWVYPIKSLPGVSVHSSPALQRGLKWDRRFMLVDETDTFMTVRKDPSLYDFHIVLEENRIIIHHERHSEPLEILLEDGSDTYRNVSIWADRVSAQVVSQECNDWFSKVLGKTCRLVKFGALSTRLISSKWNRGGEEVSFADGYPYLILSSASLKDIAVRSGTPADIRRFRPNIFIKNTTPYEEFLWSRIQIDEVIFQGLKPCGRCVVTTLDPDTKEGGKEPLRSLADLHFPQKAVFGQHAKLHTPGLVSVGSQVKILDRKDAAYDPL